MIVDQSAEVINASEPAAATPDFNAEENKFNKSKTTMDKKVQYVCFVYMTNIPRNDTTIFKLTHTQVDALSHNDLNVNNKNTKCLQAIKDMYKSMCPNNKYMALFEVIECKKAGINRPFVRFYIDSDELRNADQFMELYRQCCYLRDNGFGKFIIGGYQTIDEHNEQLPLKYIAKTGNGKEDIHHDISVHIVFYETRIQRGLLMDIMNKDKNKYAVVVKDNGASLITLGDKLTGIDGNVYSLTGEQLMRIPISDKVFSDKHVCMNNGCVLDDELNDVTDDCVISQCCITCDLNEPNIIDVGLLKQLGLYEPCNTTTITNVVTTSDNTSDNNDKQVYEHPELYLLTEILKKCTHKDGDKDKEIADDAVGIVCSATRTTFTKDTLKQVFYKWWNTDAEGKEYKHQHDDYCSNLVDNYYNKPNPKYADVDEEMYLYSVIKYCVKKEGEKDGLKALVKKVLNGYFKINGKHNTLDDIKHYRLCDLQNIRTRYDRLNAVGEAVRAFTSENEEYFLVYINNMGFYIYMQDEATLKKNVLKYLFNSKDVDAVVMELRHKCLLTDTDVITIKDIYKFDPLSNVKVESEYDTEEIKQKHIDAYKDRLLEGACNGDNDAYEYLIKRQAWIVQHIMAPSQVIDVATGAQKTGKSFDSEMFGLVLDHRHTVNCLDQTEVARTNTDFVNLAAKLDDIVGKFTKQSAKWRFANINELTSTDGKSRDDHKDYNNLKSSTDAQRRIEPKGKDAYTIQNSLNINFTSNYTRCICPDIFETRFFVHQTNPKHNNTDTEYWTNLRKVYSEKYFFKHIYDYLHSMDLTGFNVMEAPITKPYVHILMTNTTLLDRFVINNIEDLKEGVSKEKFAKLVKDNNALGCYKNVDNMFADYVSKYSCTTEYRNVCKGLHKVKKQFYIIDESLAKRITNIAEKYEELFGDAEMEVEEKPAEGNEEEVKEGEENKEKKVEEEGAEVFSLIHNILEGVKNNTKDVGGKSKDKYIAFKDVKEIMKKIGKEDGEFIEEVLNACGYHKDRGNVYVDGKRVRMVGWYISEAVYNGIDEEKVKTAITGV